MSSPRAARHVAWIILALIVLAGWVVLEITQRQLVLLRAAREADAGSRRAPSGPMQSVGPFASESGPAGSGGAALAAHAGTSATGATGATGSLAATEAEADGEDRARAPTSETDAGRVLPPGAIW